MLHPSVVEFVKSDLLRLCPQQTCKCRAELIALVHNTLEVRSAGSALLQLTDLHRLHGLRGRARERAKCACVQVRVPVKHRQAAANGYEVDVITAKTIVQAVITSRASAAGM
jgi:hypothetical protein